jgi:hypothetical protein
MMNNHGGFLPVPRAIRLLLHAATSTSALEIVHAPQLNQSNLLINFGFFIS